MWYASHRLYDLLEIETLTADGKMLPNDTASGLANCEFDGDHRQSQTIQKLSIAVG